ncbi:WD40 repeat-like protein, partial [Aspergillus affinis]|uniref:WD40 repeat-like protein n=1 Tax=Aspergillus affinis TaxID=1070780 RepID=UPI0022FE0343
MANDSPTYTPSAAPDHPIPPIPSRSSSSRPNSYAAAAASNLPPSSNPVSFVDGYRRSARVNGSLNSSSSRRRRRRSSTPETSGETTEGITGGRLGERTASEASFPDHSSIQSRTLSEGRSPSPKRRRLANMRPDGISSLNGPSHASNGSTASPSQKAGLSHALNGQASFIASNGDLHTNGSQKLPPASSTYFGHDREEVTRILIQSLFELGYNGSASMLSKESGYQLESAGVATFRGAVLDGRWAEAEKILIHSFYPDGNGRSLSNGRDYTPAKERLVLVEDAELNEMLFYLRQQKFLEMLESRDLAAALIVLRHELTPLNYDIARLHALSSLLMCPPEHLRDQVGLNGPMAFSREQLLSDLSKSISPSVMIPDNRLAILLNHVKQNQINQCRYHNTASPPSLYSDHTCDRNDFPLRTGIELNQHSDEVWYCQFSHDGTKLVTAGRDHSVIIYDTTTFAVIHKLMDHDDGVAHASWSPDDTKLITCSQDKKARVWNVE